ncbi:hypothetical protein Rctr85_059 [Virus Rctr85]|nr:hypothetical protein Rctr85_059 [Virus Rctr85]
MGKYRFDPIKFVLEMIFWFFMQFIIPIFGGVEPFAARLVQKAPKIRAQFTPPPTVQTVPDEKTKKALHQLVSFAVSLYFLGPPGIEQGDGFYSSEDAYAALHKEAQRAAEAGGLDFTALSQEINAAIATAERDTDQERWWETREDV